MITKKDDLLGTLLHDVAHLLRQDIDRRLRPFNLTRAKWLALGIIKNNPNLTQAELAIELELGAATVGRLVDRLIDRNFLTREPRNDDRRAYGLKLTKEAILLFNKLESLGSEIRHDLTEGLSTQDVDFLNTRLSVLKNRLQEISSKAGAVFAGVSFSDLDSLKAIFQLV